MMTRVLLTFLVGLVVSLGALVSSNAAHSACGKVSMAEMNWASAHLMANVDKIILSKGYGCDVSIVPGDTMPTFTSMDERGSPDVVGELWAEAVAYSLSTAKAEGRLHTVSKGPITGLGEGWWLLPHTLEKHPELKTVTDILKRPDLFPHPEDPSKGGFHTCPSGWSCQLINANLFRAFEMEKKGWRLIDPGSATGLDASIAKASDRNQNWFGYYWSPTSVVGKYDMKIVDFGVPFDGKENWDGCIVKSERECKDPKPSAWRQYEVHTVITNSLKKRFAPVGDYFANRIFPGAVMNATLAYMADQQATGEDAAAKFLKNHPEVWSKWVTPEAAQNIAPHLFSERIIASKPVKRTSTDKVANSPTSAELLAAQRKAEKLEQQLADIRAKQKQQQQTISSDTKLPTVTIASADTKGKQGIIRGNARDNTGIAEVTVGGKSVPFDASGNFKFETFVPADGKQVTIQVTDLNGLSNSKTVKLERSASNTTTAITFESLNPLGRKVAKNKDALALIIGVDGYENTPARAIYADSDAKVFADYANEKLGIPTNRIKTLVNDGADEKGMLLAVKDWLARASKKDKSDVYVFFAGHGLASQDGEKMYLLPYDGSPRLLDDTAISRDRLFADIAAANPRSVTVFLDTCYSGETRGNEMLIAGRPIGIRALEQSIPDNFTLMTAAAGDQIANPLKEAKHGMFSYFLMKGMEGVADSNQDNKITALELHEYVKENVWQQSSNKQLPELQGDENRVLVQFQ